MEEHSLFLEGLRTHGKGWKQIAAMIQSRSVVQIRTHAQKYFQKLSKAQAGGQPIGEVYMDTRPSGDDDNSCGGNQGSTNSQMSSNIPPLADLEAISTSTSTIPQTVSSKRGNGSKSNRKAKGDGNSPRRKRKMEGDMSNLSLDGHVKSSFIHQQGEGHKNGDGKQQYNMKSHSNNIDSYNVDIFASPSPGSVADPLLLGLDGLGLTPTSWYTGGEDDVDQDDLLSFDGVLNNSFDLNSHQRQQSQLQQQLHVGLQEQGNRQQSQQLSSNNTTTSGSNIVNGNAVKRHSLGGVMSMQGTGFEHPSAHEMIHDLNNVNELEWLTHQSAPNTTHPSSQRLIQGNQQLQNSSFNQLDQLSDACIHGGDSDSIADVSSNDDDGEVDRSIHRLNSDFTDDGSLSDDSEMLMPNMRQTAVLMGHVPYRSNMNTSSSLSISIPPPPPPPMHPLVSPCITSQQPSSSLQLQQFQQLNGNGGGLLRPKGFPKQSSSVSVNPSILPPSASATHWSNNNTAQRKTPFLPPSNQNMQSNRSLQQVTSSQFQFAPQPSSYNHQFQQSNLSHPVPPSSNSNQNVNSSSLESMKRPTSPTFTQESFTNLDVTIFEDVNFDEDVFATNSDFLNVTNDSF